MKSYLLASFIALLHCHPLKASESVAKFCEDYKGGRVSYKAARHILKETQLSLISATKHATKKLRQIATCFEQKTCDSLREKISRQTEADLDVYRVIAPIVERGTPILPYRNRKDAFEALQSNQVPFERYAKIDKKKYHLTKSEQQRSARLWAEEQLRTGHRILQRQMNALKDSPHRQCEYFTQPIPVDARLTNKLFKEQARALQELNPLLKYITDKDKDYAAAFTSIADDSEKFLKSLSDYKIHQGNKEDNFVESFLPFFPDHEIGLLNFPKVNLAVIEAMGPEKKKQGCVAWQWLIKKKNTRKTRSIYFGAGTTLTLGGSALLRFLLHAKKYGEAAKATRAAKKLQKGTASVYTGDAVVGGYRGYVDATAALYAAKAGRSIKGSGRFHRSGILSANEANKRAAEGTVVTAVNLFALTGLAGAFKVSGLKATLKPVKTDVAVTTSELQAPTIGEMFEGKKGDSLELYREMLRNSAAYKAIQSHYNDCFTAQPSRRKGSRHIR